MFESVIGLEIHAQLLTDSKIFCGCSTRFGAPPNTHVCPVCLGLPGALPALNARAVEYAARAALALGCTVHPVSVFARKNYFYPDLPKGYQISQYARPFATAGALELEHDGRVVRVGITRVHLEEDAGSSHHDAVAGAGRASLVDFNRSGVPLIEIVTEPDLRSAAAAAAFFTRLREILVALGITDGNMEEGSLRCDANVSVHRAGEHGLGVKAEVKNVNSFRYLQRAIEFEVQRQVDLIEAGRAVEAETRLWDTASGQTHPMRSKEGAHDYRYFPEPDLPPLHVGAAWLDEVRDSLPELPEARRRRFVEAYGLPPYDAGVLTQSPGLATYFEAVAQACGNPKGASNWVMGELLRVLKERRVEADAAPITPLALAGLIRLVDSGTISGPIARQVFAAMCETGLDAASLVAAGGLARIDDEAVIEAAARAVLAAHPAAAAQYRSGKTQAFGFLVGQVMKAMSGKGNPALVQAVLKRLLGAEGGETT
jgi:aspartyl-tRNA(Asn)/glutamyl-tRNA(Gln) amidotransferase subunit B